MQNQTNLAGMEKYDDHLKNPRDLVLHVFKDLNC